MPLTTGELLVQRGVATREQIERAVGEAKESGIKLCSRLHEMGIDEGLLAAALAERHMAPGVDLSRCAVDLKLLDLVPRAVAEGDHMLPLSDEGGRLHIAMASPADERVLSEIRFVSGMEVSAYVCVRRAVELAVRQAYDAREAGARVWRGAAAGAGLPPVLATLFPSPPAPEVEVPIEEGDEALAVEVVVGGAGGASGPGATPAPAPADAEVHEVVLRVEAAGRRRVLVVDDEPEIRLLVQRTLEKHGYEVFTAGDGADALRLCDELLPDLVLLDAMLPQVHGFEVCRRLKSAPRTRQVPVIMMTAIYRGWRFAQEARDIFGAEDYVEKPFRLDDFLKRIEAVLQATEQRPQAGADRAAAHMRRGRELAVANQLAASQKELEAAIQADPWSSEAHAMLARVQKARGDLFAAMTSYERAAELKPGHLPLLKALAALYAEKGFRRKAADTLERAEAAATSEADKATLRQRIAELTA